MSDHFIVIVPRDPLHVPSESTQRLVTDFLRRLTSSATSIAANATAAIRFFDCGGNFERVCCPCCASVIAMDWWQQRMDDDFDGEGFRLTKFDTPCCGASINLNALAYDWPQAFGRFSWTIRNANIGAFPDSAKAELEAVTGISVAVIHRRT